jgi:hypothetical protein
LIRWQAVSAAKTRSAGPALAAEAAAGEDDPAATVT